MLNRTPSQKQPGISTEFISGQTKVRNIVYFIRISDFDFRIMIRNEFVNWAKLDLNRSKSSTKKKVLCSEETYNF